MARTKQTRIHGHALGAEAHSPGRKSALVSTKLQVPPRRPGLLPRADLLSQLRRCLEGKLTLVIAPAGYGKTTFLSEWCISNEEEEGPRVCWVSVDQSDNDQARFWSYIVAAFRSVAPEMGGTALAALATLGGSPGDLFLPSLVNDLSQVSRPTVLIVDDYHLITDDVVHEDMTYLIERLPAILRLVLSTRHEPSLPVGRWRASGVMNEIRASELRFSEDEADALLNESEGLDLQPTDVARLLQRTEGWPAALYLAALSLKTAKDRHEFVARFSGSTRQMVDYLSEVALDRVPSDIAEFLLRTSILERLSGSLCDAVLERRSSYQVLRDLERSNLFIVPLDNEGHWYRYHHLFSEYLVAELGRVEHRIIPELHRRASAWHREAGYLPEAVEHALMAGDFVETSDLIVRHIPRFASENRYLTVKRWLETLPAEVVMADPRLCAVRAYVELGLGGAEESRKWLEAAERGPSEGTFDGTASTRFVVAFGRSIYWRSVGDLRRSLAASADAVKLAPEAPSPWRPGARAFHGSNLYWSGDRSGARTILEEEARKVSGPGSQLPVVLSRGTLAALCRDEGEVRRAEELARASLRLAEETALDEHYQTALAHVVLGKVSFGQGDFQQAEAELDRGIELARRVTQSQQPHVLCDGLLARADLARAHGEVSRAEELRREARQLVEDHADLGIAATALARTRHQPSAVEQQAIPHRSRLPEPVTERELDVLRLLETDLTRREIASELYVSFNTVASHLRSIYRKLGTSSRQQTTTRARKLGLL